MRYEVWSYSKSWNKWVRNVYPQHEDAQKHYARLTRLGRRVHPPQPVNKGLPLIEQVRSAIKSLMNAKKPRTRSRDLFPVKQLDELASPTTLPGKV